MKKNIFISILAAFSILTACSERPDIVFPDGGMTITALTELPDSKTTVVSETQVYWEPGDEITVFSGDMQGRFVTDITEPAAMATFKGMLYGEPDETLWAVYPYSKDATFDGETITTVLPSVQTARAGTFGKNMNLTVAKSSNSTLQFYNVGGGVRFSVTEDDIKKVIFEGLNGEILAGTVKIGFENDRPKVQEVTGGSPFITLLPPDGETFQKGKWYFIVAIPGALENGYKLRFYKDEDYARRISENAVTIKRSIYGTVASADDGLEYESTTTTFPITEKEWEETLEIANKVGLQVINIVGTSVLSGNDIETEVLNSIDGVLDAHIDPGSGSISIMQKDSVWLYYFPGGSDESVPRFEAKPTTKADANNQSISNGYSNIVKKSNTSTNINANNKALILAPFDDASVYNDVVTNLVNAGFDENNIIIKNWEDADILLFKGDYLKQYKYVYINTHGGVGYETTPNSEIEVPNQTVFLSGTPFSAHKALTLVSSKQLRKDQIALAYHSIIDSPLSSDSIPDYRFCMIPNFLDDVSFRAMSPYIVLGACSSDELEHNMAGSMVGAFLSKGVGAISGFSASINVDICHYYASFVSEFMSYGFSFQQASRFWKESDIMRTLCMSWQNYYKSFIFPYHPEIGDKKKQEIIEGINYRLYNYYPLFTNFYLVNPYPSLKDPIFNEEENTFTFSWDCDLKPFVFNGTFALYHEASSELGGRIIHGTVEYDLYVDDFLVKTITCSEDSEKVATVEVPSCGNHKWYVIGKLLIDGRVEASYKSSLGDLFVEQAGDAILEFNKDVELGLVKMGQNTTKSVTIKNTGDAPLVISGITGYDPSIISFEWTSATIAPGDSKPLAITLKQPTPGDGYHFAYLLSNAKNYENSYSYFFITWCGQRATPAYSTQMVDLGLSVKWATCDLGSDSPYEYGELYAWGETDRKSSYTWDNYKWGRSTSLTKYNDSDNLRTLQKSDDAAAAHLGGQWRMPSQNECQELIDNCNWRATKINNIDVFEGTSKINGKKIYFKRRENTVGQLYVFWTKDLWFDIVAHIFTLNYYDFDSDECVLEASVGQYRSNGYYIRPVYGVESTPVHAFTVSPSSFHFGEVNVGQSSERKVFTFNNDGDADVEFWVESCPDGFIYPDGMHGGTHSRVPAHGSRTGFWIRFDPTQAKNYSGTVVLRTNDPEFPVVRINVSGKGVRSGSGGGEPHMSLSSDSYDFGTVAVNTNKKTSFTITNTGTADLDVTTIKLVNGNKGFYLANTTKTGIVPPGGTCVINVMFRPTKKGSVSEQILVKSNATNKSYTMIYLSGTGQ